MIYILSTSSEMPWHRFVPSLHSLIDLMFPSTSRRKKKLKILIQSGDPLLQRTQKESEKNRWRKQAFLRVTWPREWKRSQLEFSVAEWAISISRKCFYHLLCHKQKSKINCLLSCIKCFWPVNWKTNFIFSLHCLRHLLTSIFITDKEGKLKWSVTVQEKTNVSEF